VVAADNPGAVAKLYHDDPFWPTGLRKSVRVSRMKPRFCRRQADTLILRPRPKQWIDSRC
jgi:hypothetical protein